MKKILTTLILQTVLVVALIAAVFSYKGLNRKLRLEDETQATIKVINKEESLDNLEVIEDNSTIEEVDDQIGEIIEDESEIIEEKPEVMEEESNENSEEEEPSDPDAPTLVLRSKQIVISQGESFNLISPVEDITDNIDSRNSLFHNIQVRGDYDVNTPGEYTLVYTVVDSDGYESAPRELKLIVKQQ
ncbi:MAG: DUF5011 domain-containing protein [Eubacterium sp.]|nr:DUF5011 domain-containing protein [Eubacterium sp.]